MSDIEQRHSTRVAIISACVSLALSVVFAAYIVGQRTGKVLDIEKWRAGAAPRMERIDAQGTLSQQFFLKSYSEEQAKQYKRLEKLEDQVSHLETMKLRLDRLEQRVNDGKPRQE